MDTDLTVVHEIIGCVVKVSTESTCLVLVFLMEFNLWTKHTVGKLVVSHLGFKAGF